MLINSFKDDETIDNIIGTFLEDIYNKIEIDENNVKIRIKCFLERYNYNSKEEVEKTLIKEQNNNN